MLLRSLPSSHTAPPHYTVLTSHCTPTHVDLDLTGGVSIFRPAMGGDRSSAAAGAGVLLPVVDLASADVAAAAKSIRQACEEFGFFYVVNHEIDAALMARTYAESNKFFAQPMAEKMKLLKNSSHAGYIPPNFEGFEVASGKTGDLFECFNVIRPVVNDDLKNDVNQWPSEECFSSWNETMDLYYKNSLATGKKILSLIALSLDLDAEFFEDSLATVLRPLHYSGEVKELADGSYGANPHSDYGLITLLSTDGTPGLQICREKDNHPQLWEDIQHIDGALIINIGDLLERWTNCLFRSTMHRVVMVGKERYSVALFICPNPDKVIKCLETCCSEANPPRFPPIRSVDYLEEKLSSSYKSLTI